MTPKEKAKELFKNIYSKIFDIDNGANVMQDKKRFDAAKNCALIAANEVIDALSKYTGMHDQDFIDADKDFYIKVKVEIEAL